MGGVEGMLKALLLRKRFGGKKKKKVGFKARSNQLITGTEEIEGLL